ncbi:MAG: hypothetical protein AAGH99_00290 [Planctomycetota bacterium]
MWPIILNYLIGRTQETLDAFWTGLTGWFWETWNQLVEWCVEKFWQLVDYLDELFKSWGIDLEPYVQQMLGAVQTIIPLIGDFAWIFPIFELIVIYLTAYATMLTVRTIRTIVGKVPTIDG